MSDSGREPNLKTARSEVYQFYHEQKHRALRSAVGSVGALSAVVLFGVYAQLTPWLLAPLAALIVLAVLACWLHDLWLGTKVRQVRSAVELQPDSPALAILREAAGSLFYVGGLSVGGCMLWLIVSGRPLLLDRGPTRLGPGQMPMGPLTGSGEKQGSGASGARPPTSYRPLPLPPGIVTHGNPSPGQVTKGAAGNPTERPRMTPLTLPFTRSVPKNPTAPETPTNPPRTSPGAAAPVPSSTAEPGATTPKPASQVAK
jgi:hypothetical protein